MSSLGVVHDHGAAVEIRAVQALVLVSRSLVFEHHHLRRRGHLEAVQRGEQVVKAWQVDALERPPGRRSDDVRMHLPVLLEEVGHGHSYQ